MLIFLCLFVPFFLSYFEKNFQKLIRVDAILLAYGLGMFLRFIFNDSLDFESARIMVYISIPLAMPLLLFQADFLQWIQKAPETVKCFALVSVSTVFAAILASLIMGNQEINQKIAAMLTGVYTGGSPNLNAVGLSLKVKPELLAVANLIDLMGSSIYLIFMLTLAPPMVRKFLPLNTPKIVEMVKNPTSQGNGFLEFAKPLLLSVSIFGFSLLVSHWIYNDISVPLLMLLISLGGIAFSMKPSVRSLGKSEIIGNYLILVFCFSMGLQMNIGELFHNVNALFLQSLITIILSFLFHFLSSKWFKIDGQIFLICSISAVMSPAFVPMFTKKFGNEKLLLPGIVSGLAGFAIGNILGLSVYFFLRNV